MVLPSLPLRPRAHPRAGQAEGQDVWQWLCGRHSGLWTYSCRQEGSHGMSRPRASRRAERIRIRDDTLAPLRVRSRPSGVIREAANLACRASTPRRASRLMWHRRHRAKTLAVELLRALPSRWWRSIAGAPQSTQTPRKGKSRRARHLPASGVAASPRQAGRFSPVKQSWHRRAVRPHGCPQDSQECWWRNSYRCWGVSPSVSITILYYIPTWKAICGHWAAASQDKVKGES